MAHNISSQVSQERVTVLGFHNVLSWKTGSRFLFYELN